MVVPSRSLVEEVAWALFHPDPAMEQAGLPITQMEESTFVVNILNLYRYLEIKKINTDTAPISADPSILARLVRQAMSIAILVPFTVSTTWNAQTRLLTHVRFHVVVQPDPAFNAYTTYDPAWIRPWLRDPVPHLSLYSPSES